MRDDLYTYEEEMFVEAMFNFNGINLYDYSEDNSCKENSKENVKIDPT